MTHRSSNGEIKTSLRLMICMNASQTAMGEAGEDDARSRVGCASRASTHDTFASRELAC